EIATKSDDDSIEMLHDLSRRKEQFKRILTQAVHRKHELFLNSIGIEEIPLEKLQCWHSKFNVEGSCKDLVNEFADEEQAFDFLVGKLGKSQLKEQKLKESESHSNKDLKLNNSEPLSNRDLKLNNSESLSNKDLKFSNSEQFSNKDLKLNNSEPLS